MIAKKGKSQSEISPPLRESRLMIAEKGKTKGQEQEDKSEVIEEEEEDDGYSHCPVCEDAKLKGATLFYPLCNCNHSLCFSCLQRIVTDRFRCPFCNLDFTSETLRQSEQDLKKKMLKADIPGIEDSELTKYVQEWTTVLKSLAASMEDDLAFMDCAEDDVNGVGDDLPDLFAGPLALRRRGLTSRSNQSMRLSGMVAPDFNWETETTRTEHSTFFLPEVDVASTAHSQQAFVLPRCEPEEKNAVVDSREEKMPPLRSDESPSLRVLGSSTAGDRQNQSLSYSAQANQSLSYSALTPGGGSYPVLPEVAETPTPLVEPSPPTTSLAPRAEPFGPATLLSRANLDERGRLEAMKAQIIRTRTPSPRALTARSDPTSDALPKNAVPLVSYLSDPNDPGVPQNQILKTLRVLKSSAATADVKPSRESILASPDPTSPPLPIGLNDRIRGLGSLITGSGQDSPGAGYSPALRPRREPPLRSALRSRDFSSTCRSNSSETDLRLIHAQRAVTAPVPRRHTRLSDPGPAPAPSSESQGSSGTLRVNTFRKKQKLRPGSSLPVPGARRRNNNTDRMIRKRIAKLRSMLGLGIREMVTVNSTGKIGVLMKISRRGTDLMLTIRLLDGTWLKRVEISKVSAKGTRAGLDLYLRLGDIMLTRFGVAIVRGINSESGEISVEFRGPHKYNTRPASLTRKWQTERAPTIRHELLRDFASGPTTTQSKKSKKKGFKLPGGRISYRRSTSEDQGRQSLALASEVETASAGNTPKKPSWESDRVSNVNDDDIPAPHFHKEKEIFTIHLSDVQQVLCAEDVLVRLEAKLTELANYRGLGSALAPSIAGDTLRFAAGGGAPYDSRLASTEQKEARDAVQINFSLAKNQEKESDDESDSLPAVVGDRSETVESLKRPDNHPSWGSYDDNSIHSSRRMPDGNPTPIYTISGVDVRQDSQGMNHVLATRAT